MLLTTFAGCGGYAAKEAAKSTAPVTSQSPAQAEKTNESEIFPLEVVDGLGRKVTLAKEPARIVSIAPKNTELVFAIGAGDKLVGVTSYCNYPPEAKERTVIGGFSAKSLSLEKIVSLQPDLVLAAGDLHATVINELERVEVPVLSLSAETLEDMFQELSLLGRVTGHADQSEQLVASLQARIARVREKTAAIPETERLTVFYQVWDEPLGAAGPSSFVGQIVELAGGINIFADTTTRYPQISHEVLLERNPQTLVGAQMASAPVTVESIRNRPGWSNLRAVRDNRVYLIDGDKISRCGPRAIDSLEEIAQHLYPKQFADSAGASPDTENAAGETSP